MLERLMRITVTAALACAVTGVPVASAQDDDDDGGAFGDDSSLLAEDTIGGDVPQEVVASGLTGGYPSAYLYRPRTLPKGSWEAGLDFAYQSNGSLLFIADNDPITANAGGLSFGFGVTDEILVGASYNFALKDFEIEGIFSLDAAYLWKTDEQKQIVPQISIGYSVLGSSFGPLVVGPLIQYDLGDKIAVFSKPSLVVQPGVTVGAETIRPISIEAPASLGYQFTNQFFAELGTLVARAKVADTASGFVISDFLPVQVTALVTLLGSQLDVGARLRLDLRPPDGVDGGGNPADTPIGDTIEFLVVARYRGGL